MLIYLAAVGVGLLLIVIAVTRLSARHHEGDSGSSDHRSPSDPGGYA